MPKISKFTLVSPGSFYVRKLTYTCTSCGESFKFDIETATEDLQTAEREHVCHKEEPKGNTATFPLIKILRDQQKNAKR